MAKNNGELYPVLYKVSYWDDISTECLKRNGIIYALGITDAIAQITNWYGEDDIDSVSVTLLEYQLFEISDAEYDDFLKRG